ncbi:MAG: histidinol dehydrogenase, partial [Myxococcales bacterium]|nr:histidinol dehydrogenase [Myxococcales bacterium]
MRIHRGTDTDFEAALRSIEDRLAEDAGPEAAVREILDAVRKEGDVAVLRYTERFDGVILAADEMEIAPEVIEDAASQCAPELLAALKVARDRIVAFHEKEARRSWRDRSEDGIVLGQRITPMARAGLYVPGGKAAYPSSVLMTAIPAKVAGVDEV